VSRGLGHIHEIGQLGLNLGEPRLHPARDLAAVFSGEHHGRAHDRFLAIKRGGAGAKLRAELDLAHVLHEQRRDANLLGRAGCVDSAWFRGEIQSVYRSQ
jgi:hypothetical protein